jgi:hypothetical protein
MPLPSDLLAHLNRQREHLKNISDQMPANVADPEQAKEAKLALRSAGATASTEIKKQVQRVVAELATYVTSPDYDPSNLPLNQQVAMQALAAITVLLPLYTSLPPSLFIASGLRYEELDWKGFDEWMAEIGNYFLFSAVDQTTGQVHAVN